MSWWLILQLCLWTFHCHWVWGYSQVKSQFSGHPSSCKTSLKDSWGFLVSSFWDCCLQIACTVPPTFTRLLGFYHFWSSPLPHNSRVLLWFRYLPRATLHSPFHHSHNHRHLHSHLSPFSRFYKSNIISKSKYFEEISCANYSTEYL